MSDPESTGTESLPAYPEWLVEALSLLDDASASAHDVMERCDEAGRHPDIEFRDLLGAVDHARSLAGGYDGGDPDSETSSHG